ncbi:hypothetical protein ABKV19_025136 [Rosa sericea]
MASLTTEVAASSSYSSLPCSSTDYQKHYTYEVFLSFRGEDTRFNFTDHLYTALCQRGIETFRDADKLRRGEEISAALLKAIEESRVTIIVFSQNYASSRWCLDELVKILECRKSKGQEVISVFYKVDPSHVRHQTGAFGDAFATLDQFKYKDSMDKWREALLDAANLSGWPYEEDRSEAEFIQEIVGDLSARIVNPSCVLPVAAHPIGIESFRQDVKRLLEENNMVGIWGPGGIGKTTIAKDVFNSISHKFKCRCFLADVRSNALVQLQERLLFDILRDPTLKVRSVDEGVSFINIRMQRKRVLLILDDVSDYSQLRKLVPSLDCFGPGSRILITTRDKRWLIAHQVDEVYEVKLLDDRQALNLFSLNAFNRNGPPSDYLELAQRVVRYAQGLPLALIVLGSHLFHKSRDEWEATLDGGKGEDPHIEIRNVLKISYDALGVDLKGYFLDIACFFKGKYVDNVKPILEACYDLKSVIGIAQLQQKALIRIDNETYKGGRIWMHDLIEEMGKDIVYQEGEPGERSRLWNYDDVDHVLTDTTGTKNIRGIQIQLHPQKDEICLNAKSFSGMKNLKYFSSSKWVQSSGNIDYLSNELRWLNWFGCPIQSFPSDFHSRKLVALKIPNSPRITRLWEGLKNFPILTSMDLRGCKSLRELPNFIGIPNLEELNLYGCESLVEVHQSVGSLDKLVTLNLGGCSNLVKLPTEISLKSLHAMYLSGCTRLEEFPNFIGKMDSFKELNLSLTSVKELHPLIGNLIGLRLLDLDDCKNLTTLPCSIYGLQNLEILKVSGCSKFVTFPEIKGKMNSLKKLYLKGSDIIELHPSIGNLIWLDELDLDDCKNLTTLPCSIYELQNLEILKVSGCSKFVTFSEIKGKMNSLKKLYLKGSDIIELHPSIGNLIWLDELDLDDCKNLTTLPCSIYELQNLEILKVSGCSKFVTFPEIKGKMNSLKKLYLKGSDIIELHPSIGNLIWLDELDLDDCKNLTTLPCSIYELQNLEILKVSGCSKFVTFSEIKGKMNSLKKLYLKGSGITELHPSIGNLIGLDELDLDGCEDLTTIPCSIYELQNLEILNVSRCSNLVTFPTKASISHDHDGGSLVLPKLRVLIINGCNLSTAGFIGSLDCLETLTKLDLSSNNFVNVPALGKFVNLSKIDLRCCKRLREIPELQTRCQQTFRYVFNSIRHKFECSCFLADVRSNALVQLQERFLFDILRVETLKVHNVDKGVGLIKTRMQNKKVLLILDDVSHSSQLQNLVPSPDCFGPGSRILITTRDKRWLIAHQVDEVYEVKLLDDRQALNLFSLNAFDRNGPPSDYLELAQRAVRYAQGLPLALIVLGSHLFHKSRDEWEATLDGGKREDPHIEIRNVLRISYDALGVDLKGYFLDIACFFNGQYVDNVKPILESCYDFKSVTGIAQLQQKALIRIDYETYKGGRIWMHDLIEEMGKDIVYQEGEPGERSRLWNYDDVDHVLTDNTGTKNIRGIQIQPHPQKDKICLNAKSFSGMKNLKYFSSSKWAYAELLEEEAIDIPAWFTFASKDGINVVSGDSIFERASIANACKQVVAVGINCTPPRFIQGLISSIRKVTSKPIVIYPNSGETYDGFGRVDEEFAKIVIEKWREAGASLFGGCCRTTPNTIRAISKAISNKSSAVNDAWFSSENEM